MKSLKIKFKYLYVYLCFILLAINFIQVGLSSQPIKLTQEGYNIEILDIKNELIISNNGSSLWSETITIRILENYSETKSINFVYNMEIHVESIQLNGTLSPIRMIIDGGKSSVEIVPITEINMNDILIIVLNGYLNVNIENLQNNNWLLRYNWGINYLIPKMSLTIFLPESTYIAGSDDSLEIFPNGYEISSNGKSIILIWDNLVLVEPSATNTIIIEIVIPNVVVEDINIKSENIDNSFHFLSFLWGIILILFIFVASILIFIKFYKISLRQYLKNLKSFIRNKGSVDSTDLTKIRTTRIPVIVKPQQNRLLSIIQENGGTINQNDLVLQSGLSKARISQYLKELDELHLISREKQGRENLIYLKADLGL